MTTSTIDELPVEAAFSCRFDERRHAILEAALELIVEVGYERMSMDALAERAHASKATIYRHWDGKAAIVAEAVQKRQCESLAMSTPGPSVATCSVSWRKLVARWPKVTAPLLRASSRRCAPTMPWPP